MHYVISDNDAHRNINHAISRVYVLSRLSLFLFISSVRRQRFRFLRDSTEILTHSNSEDVDSVILPLSTGAQAIGSDE